MLPFFSSELRGWTRSRRKKREPWLIAVGYHQQYMRCCALHSVPSMQWEPNRTGIMTHAQWTEQQNLIHYLSKGKGTIANNTVDAPLDCYWMVGDAIESIICKEIQISKLTFQSLTFRIKKPRKSLKFFF